MSVALGAERVRRDFNPSQNAEVTIVKDATADLIDHMDKFKANGE